MDTEFGSDSSVAPRAKVARGSDTAAASLQRRLVCQQQKRSDAEGHAHDLESARIDRRIQNMWFIRVGLAAATTPAVEVSAWSVANVKRPFGLQSLVFETHLSFSG